MKHTTPFLLEILDILRGQKITNECKSPATLFGSEMIANCSVGEVGR